MFPKPVIAQLDQRQASSDAGAPLPAPTSRRLGLTGTLADPLVGRRPAGNIDHPVRELPRRRIFGIACGDADANDAAQLAQGKTHNMLAARNPVEDGELASQPACRAL